MKGNLISFSLLQILVGFFFFLFVRFYETILNMKSIIKGFH